MNRTITKCRRLPHTFYNAIVGYPLVCYSRRAAPAFNSRARNGHNDGTYRKSIRLISKRLGSNTMQYYSYSFMRQYVFSDLKSEDYIEDNYLQ